MMINKMLPAMPDAMPKLYQENHFYVGLVLAISSSFFIGISFILTKKGLSKLTQRAGKGGYGYLRQRLWWAGMISMAIGECANFTAYMFAPATVVTPLGALSIIVSACLAQRYLSETLNVLGKLGCTLCILGSTVLVIHAPQESDVQSMDELYYRITSLVFLSYTGFVIGVAFVLIWCVRPSVSAQNPLIYITITGTIGSLTVMSCKGLGVALKETFSGTNRLTNPITCILLLSVIVCIIIQLNYMNKALDLFQTAVVSPLLYVVFTSCVILASVLLFHEWKGLSSVDIVSIICAFLVILVGVFLLQYFKDINVSITQTKVVTNVNPSPTKKLPIS